MKVDKVLTGAALKRLLACLVIFISCAQAAAGQAAWESDIRAKAAAFNLGRPLPESPRPRQTPPPRDQGWWQGFDGGWVYWTPGHGARLVRGRIFEAWAGQRWEQGRLGFPTSDELACQVPDARDLYQRFEGGVIYWRASTGVATVHDDDGQNRRTFGDNGVCHPTLHSAPREAAVVTAATAVAAPREATTVEQKKVEAAPIKETVAPFPPPERGRFRVTLNGFVVNHETHDDILERDGKRDEVYILADIWVIDRAGNVVLPRRSVRSPVMGDYSYLSNPARVQAGGAGDLGGLRTGDGFPARDAWRRAKGSEPLPDRLPLRLVAPAEVELVAGENAVVIMVTAWEWDGNQELQAEWNDHVERWIAGFKDSVGRDISNGSLARPFVNFVGSARFNTERGGDRPVGMRPGTENLNLFIPQLMILTYAGAQEAARSSNTPDKGPGIFELRYREPVCCGLDGDYSLFLQVEAAP